MNGILKGYDFTYAYHDDIRIARLSTDEHVSHLTLPLEYYNLSLHRYHLPDEIDQNHIPSLSVSAKLF